MSRTIHSSVTLGHRQASPGFVEATVFHGGPVALDPFLAITDFHMSQPTFAPHPHAGFSAVTYMFRDSAGSFRNRDSLGDVSLIGPGDLHWTQAASGMLHEEIPVEPGLDCHGLQLFVNLRASDKHAAPRAFHVSAEEVPMVEPTTGVAVRVVVGAAFDVASPLTGLLTSVTLLDIELQPQARVAVPVAAKDHAVMLLVEGSIEAGGAALQRPAVAALPGPGEHLDLTAGPTGATLLLLSGTPIAEPVLFGGPFCMTNEADLADARERFGRGEMGRLAPSF